VKLPLDKHRFRFPYSLIYECIGISVEQVRARYVHCTFPTNGMENDGRGPGKVRVTNSVTNNVTNGVTNSVLYSY
jgi:hypothetical protein